MFDMNKLPPLTIGLIAASIMVAIATEIGTRLGPAVSLLFSWPHILDGEFWRLITPVFIHFGITHIAFNSIMAFQLGSTVEHHKGTGHMAAFMIVSAVLSNLTQYFATGSGGFGGLSGIVYAMFGYVWMQAQFNRRDYIPLDQQFVFIMLGWFVLCWTGLMGDIANWAHTGGLVVGVIWGYAVAQMDGRAMTRW